MPVFKNIIALFCLLVITTAVTAQKPKTGKPAATATVPKFKPPKLKCTLGNRSDTVVIPVDEALMLIKSPLVVTDDKKAVYTISSYQCMYKRKGVTEDEQSGKVSPVNSVVSQLFKTTPLSDVWISTISDELKSGEEVTFFDIVAKDAQGHLMFAPNIKLVIQ